jgi:hypothetical protein
MHNNPLQRGQGSRLLVHAIDGITAAAEAADQEDLQGSVGWQGRWPGGAHEGGR